MSIVKNKLKLSLARTVIGRGITGIMDVFRKRSIFCFKIHNNSERKNNTLEGDGSNLKKKMVALTMVVTILREEEGLRIRLSSTAPAWQEMIYIP